MSERLVVVGDIHGHIRAFDQVLDFYGDSIDGVIPVGDLIAGGNESKEVIDRCRQIGARAVIGNGEWDTLKPIYHYDRTEQYDMRLAWMMLGHKIKRETLFDSYGVPKGIRPAEQIERFAETFEELGHADYLRNLPLYVDESDFVAVHAGLTDVSWGLQKVELDLAAISMRSPLPNFAEAPAQISDHALARDPFSPTLSDGTPVTDKVLVTGHAHKGCGSAFMRVTDGGNRVRLATHHWQGEPLLVWENWTGDVRQFTSP